mmetsp:Transcript_52064/g.144256  ORF Transcript_52064/g.144256 Transcript_52064/m.144256 type:complete len:281 (+) Transcript_52064:57-899(+)
MVVHREPHTEEAVSPGSRAARQHLPPVLHCPYRVNTHTPQEHLREMIRYPATRQQCPGRHGPRCRLSAARHDRPPAGQAPARAGGRGTANHTICARPTIDSINLGMIEAATAACRAAAACPSGPCVPVASLPLQPQPSWSWRRQVRAPPPWCTSWSCGRGHRSSSSGPTGHSHPSAPCAARAHLPIRRHGSACAPASRPREWWPACARSRAATLAAPQAGLRSCRPASPLHAPSTQPWRRARSPRYRDLPLQTPLRRGASRRSEDQLTLQQASIAGTESS